MPIGLAFSMPIGLFFSHQNFVSLFTWLVFPALFFAVFVQNKFVLVPGALGPVLFTSTAMSSWDVQDLIKEINDMEFIATKAPGSQLLDSMKIALKAKIEGTHLISPSSFVKLLDALQKVKPGCWSQNRASAVFGSQNLCWSSRTLQASVLPSEHDNAFQLPHPQRVGPSPSFWELCGCCYDCASANEALWAEEPQRRYQKALDSFFGQLANEKDTCLAPSCWDVQAVPVCAWQLQCLWCGALGWWTF